MKKFLLITVLFLAVTTLANADGIFKRVKFQKGQSSAIFLGAVSRGDVDTYILRAAKDQNMKVSVTSVQDNAVFTIFNEKTGKFLKGAAKGDEAVEFYEELPSSGDYKILVSPSKGNASYKLNVEVIDRYFKF